MSLFDRLRPLCRRLLAVQLVNSQCTSIVGEKAIRLSREYAREASELSVTFTIKWPLLLFWRKASVLGVRLFDASGNSVVEPAIQLIQANRLGTTYVKVVLPSAKVAPLTVFRLVIHRQKDEQDVGVLELLAVDFVSIAGNFRWPN
jgi:hypothetical protein